MENQTGNLIFKDVCEIYGRLFNHHPAISAEIQYFLKKFQDLEKKNQIQWLYNINQKSSEINEIQIDKFKTQSDSNLAKLENDLKRATDLSDNILKDSKEMKSHCEKSLNECRQSRQLEWTDFLTEISKQKGKINNDFDEKELKLKNHFRSIEEKVGIDTVGKTFPDSIRT